MKEVNISKNIAELRKKKGITQEQLALALNISPQDVPHLHLRAYSND